ncbi:MAG: hypothetical protein DKINENOH_04654 [bacterium]|nr:hypothetical protein [bacterium]MCK6561573.1 DUF2461 domain-containing protein [bacterium]NUM65306.1 DUF2461 domain-containing protein [candidate division KSB1 bacterium]
MSYFTEQYLKFFRALTKHNQKSWFEANRDWFETEVKQPFTAFVEEMIARIHADDPEVRISSKEAIFRIYRDIRFAKDKTPYKLHMSALISPAGRGNLEYPGFYLELGSAMVMLGGGAYSVAGENVPRLRRALLQRPQEFAALLRDRKFRAKYGTLQGEQNKILPAEFKAAAQQQPLIANKQFYYLAELPPDTILKRKLPEFIMTYYHAGKPMNRFLREALGYR